MKTWAEELIEEGMAKVLEKGVAEGMAHSLLRILAVRGLSVDDGSRHRILSCADLDVLDQWIFRAATAMSLAEVLVE